MELKKLIRHLKFEENNLYFFYHVENNNHNEPIQDFDWCGNGAILATQCKDKYVRILDPRSKNPIVKCANSHMNIRDSKVTWLKDEKYIITTGKFRNPFLNIY